MNDEVGFCAASLSTVEVRGAQSDATLAGPVHRPRAMAPPRRRGDGWHSTLSPLDLADLLTVLERDLIPSLLSGYSPAHHAPLVTPRSAK